MQKKFDISIVVLSYNTKDLLRNCLSSLYKLNTHLKFQIIVPDNGSSDGSPEMVTKDFKDVFLIKNNKNLGFARGNNVSKPHINGRYILFLNSDTLVPQGTIDDSYKFMENNLDVGAMTVKTVLGNGDFDRDTRRSFITPWIGLTHLFLKLDRIFPKSKIFGRYWYGYIPDTEIHEVDVIQGAYFFVRKKVLDKVGWFDESYFLDGEDIDLCWRIKTEGWKIKYYPKVQITHFKGATKGKVKSEHKNNVSLGERLKFRMAGVDSMERFYKKWLWKKYPLLINLTVLLGIKTMKLIRFVRTLILG